MERPALIVLDTHAWVWWLSRPERLGRKALRAIDRASRIGVPAICVWEVAMKVKAGKLRLDRPCDVWVDEALAEDRRVEVLALAPTIGVSAAELPWNHADPADRFIVATARAHAAPLVTADARIHESGLVRCVWD
jgi:PIN domain nuclease of toxin-antitoxin system